MLALLGSALAVSLPTFGWVLAGLVLRRLGWVEEQMEAFGVPIPAVHVEAHIGNDVLTAARLEVLDALAADSVDIVSLL